MVDAVKLLTHLQSGESAIIGQVTAEESLYQRLSALGFRAGKRIHVIRRAPLQGPIQVRIGSTDIMLRLTDANRIRVKPV
jgi:ferrous iron transport protein A